VNLGDTFVWCPPGTVTSHLWIVISRPNDHDGKCVVVNLTESCHGKYSVTLVRWQHRWIYKDSDVNFADAFLTSESHLQSQVRIGSAVPHDPMDPDLLKMIIKKALSHPAIAPNLKKYLPAL
jgi:hypothetical protein